MLGPQGDSGIPGRVGLAFGGDYNPEQWPEDVWPEDIRLMQEAGVTLVSLGIFSWALLEPEPGRYEFGWLDRILDLLHAGGISVDLANATASPPPWLARRHPESLPVNHAGSTLYPGSRQAFCPSSTAYRSAAQALTLAIGERYASHPALVMWHVNNEYGCHNAHCYCDVSAAAFRRWLERKYGSVDALNEAWGTAFWSQHYSAWDEIQPARLTTSFGNPTQELDFRRFSSDELLECFVAERDILHRVSPGVPVTTNFMVPNFKNLDYWAWADQTDVVSNDHYLPGWEAEPHLELAFGADLTRGLAGESPWLLMEHSTSAVNWQHRNYAKTPGQLRRNSLAHVARGSEGAMFFQWRAAKAGAEKFHSALLPHAGTDTKVWREVVQLGDNLRSLAPIEGSRVESQVAIVFDWDSWWAVEGDCHPSADLRYVDQARDLYSALWRKGITCSFVRQGEDLSGYRLVLVPTLHVVTDAGAAAVCDYVAGGGTALVGYFSGIVDENDHIRLGGYPAPFRELLGITVEEFFPLRTGERVHLTTDLGEEWTSGLWTELMTADGCDVVASYSDGPLVGHPAVTRNSFGAGSAWYVSARLEAAEVATLLDRIVGAAGVTAVAAAAQPGLEMVRRRGVAAPGSGRPGASYLFLINHSDTAIEVAAAGHDLLTGDTYDATTTVAAGAVLVIDESAPADFEEA